MTDYKQRDLEDFDWALGLNRLSLRFMGIWPDEQDFMAKYIKTIFRIPCMISTVLLFMVVPQMCALSLIYRDLLLVLDNLITSCPSLFGCLKLFFLWRNRNVLRPVVKSVREDWLSSKQSWEREAMRKEAAIAKVFTIGGYVIINVAYLSYIFAPIFGLHIRVINNITDYGKRYLLLQSYHPYDHSKSPNFELTHLTQVMAGFFVAMSLAIPDNYFGALVFHLSAQFQILGTNIEHLIRDGDYRLPAGEKSNIFNQILGAYVRRHVHLIRMVSAIENSFNLLMLSQLFCMCVMASCLGFRILHAFSNSEETVSVYQVLSLTGALTGLMIFALGDCFASESLATYSGGMLLNIYSCKWYAIPQQSTRDFTFMMAMSTKPQSLTAGKIVYLSLSTFCSILKSIAGYLSVLIAVSS